MNHPQSTEKERQLMFEGSPPLSQVPAPQYYPPQEEEPNLLDYWRILMKKKWQIILLPILCVAIAYAITLKMPAKYKAEVSLMPITSSGGGMASLMSQVSSVPLLGGALGDMGKLGGGKGKELVNILKSKTLTEKIIKRFDLLKVIYADQYNSATNEFQPGFPAFLKPIPVLEDAVSKFIYKIEKVDEDKKSGLIKIQVVMRDPVLAAKVANQMVVELQQFIENNSLTVSKRNRVFLEEQLVKTRAKLLEAGKDLNQFYSNNRISSIIPQLDVDVGSYQKAARPFAEFEEEFAKISNLQADAESKKEQARVSAVPGQVYLQYLTLNRELLGKTYALLTQQYEIAKIDEAKEDLAFQVIDKAEIKVRQDSPKLIINLALGFMGGFLIAVSLAFFSDYIETLKKKNR